MREPGEHAIQAAKSSSGLGAGAGAASHAEITFAELGQIGAPAEAFVLCRPVDSAKEPVIQGHENFHTREYIRISHSGKAYQEPLTSVDEVLARAHEEM
jgi:hypothetical protein